MKQYINKDVLAAKIENRIKETESMQSMVDPFWEGQISAFDSVFKNKWETLRPTHQMACAWLRKKHFIIVVTPVLFNVDYENFKWGYDIWADDNLKVSSEDFSNPLKSYEEATEEALKYVLENLI